MGRVLAGVATPGIAGRPGFLCGFRGESAVLPIQVVVADAGAGPNLVRFAAESVLPVLDGGKVAWVCVGRRLGADRRGLVSGISFCQLALAEP